jgi:RNA polymerase sigma-70 factor (ECF subfamily)
VARWAGRLGGPSIDVEDVVQEVFLKAHRLLPEFRPGTGRVTTWLYRLTENEVRHQRRRERIRRWFGASARVPEAAPEIPSPSPSAHQQLEQRQELARFYRVLDGMNERYRSALVLFELEGVSGEELAALTGAPSANAAFVLVHRARADFLKRLSKLRAEEGE